MTAEDAWELAVDELQREMPRAAWMIYVRDTRLISYEMGCFRIEATDEIAMAWLTARLTSTVRRMLTGMMNRAVEVVFVAKQESQSDLFKKEGRKA